MKHIAPISGFAYLIKGFESLNNKGLKRFVLIPLIINLVIFAVLLYFSGHYFAGFVHWLDAKLPSWLQWLNWILWPLFVIAASLFVVYTFTIIANIVGAPFNSFLSEKVELIQIGKKPGEDESMWDAVKDMPRTIKRQGQIILYYIPRVIIILILFLIPGINIIASFLWFLFSSWTLAMQYLDYPMDNHKISFKDMQQHMKKKSGRTLAFGVMVMIATLIPIVNFVVMPAAVIGATMMYLDDFEKEDATRD
jgi:CysZ protein